MNIGDSKGQILDQEIKSRSPKVVLELGSYCGYSSIRMANLLPNDSILISIDVNPFTTKIAK